jgi:hypothetical protein
MSLLMLDAEPRQPDRKPTSRQLVLLLTLPFFIAWGTAVAGLYPYGGTRHDAFLAIFAMSGVSLGLARVKIQKSWLKLAVLAGALAVGNLLPSRSSGVHGLSRRAPDPFSQESRIDRQRQPHPRDMRTVPWQRQAFEALWPAGRPSGQL